MLHENLNKPKTLFYSPALNRFIDNEWYVIHDLHQLFDTWQLDQWKRNGGENTIMTARDGILWELFYLDEEEADEVYELILWNEFHGIIMDRGEIIV